MNGVYVSGVLSATCADLPVHLLVCHSCASTSNSDVHYWKDDGTVTAGALASEIDQYPYVSITISTGD
jgi:hypothetical protein